MEDAWKEYENDFNAMTDIEIDVECERSLSLIDEHEGWLEAVSLWRAAGSPRKVDDQS